MYVHLNVLLCSSNSSCDVILPCIQRLRLLCVAAPRRLLPHGSDVCMYMYGDERDDRCAQRAKHPLQYLDLHKHLCGTSGSSSSSGGGAHSSGGKSDGSISNSSYSASSYHSNSSTCVPLSGTGDDGKQRDELELMLEGSHKLQVNRCIYTYPYI